MPYAENNEYSSSFTEVVRPKMKSKSKVVNKSMLDKVMEIKDQLMAEVEGPVEEEGVEFSASLVHLTTPMKEKLSLLKEEEAERTRKISMLIEVETERARRIAMLKEEETKLSEQISMLQFEKTERLRWISLLKVEETEREKKIFKLKAEEEERGKRIMKLKAEEKEREKIIFKIKQEEVESEKRILMLRADERERENRIFTLKDEEADRIDQTEPKVVMSGPMFVTGKLTKNEKYQPISSFHTAGLSYQLLQNISKAHMRPPTTVQSCAFPIIQGGRDLMMSATVAWQDRDTAFLIPIIQRLSSQQTSSYQGPTITLPQALILSPSREMASQIFDEALKFTQGLVVNPALVIGGNENLIGSCHIVSATLGKLMNMVNQGRIRFSNLKFLVLVEASLLLDDGSIGMLRECFDHPSMPKKGNRQTLMFSRIFPNHTQDTASEFLKDYLFMTMDKDDDDDGW